MKESGSLSSVEQCSSSVILESMNICNEQVEIDQEVVTDSHIFSYSDIVVASNSVMANTNQTARKASGGQGPPAQFGSRGKPGKRRLSICGP